MDTAEILVLASGIILISFVLWFFFGAREATVAKSDNSGVQEVEVTVKGGYTPDLIEVKQGQPLRLLFKREESNPCTEQVIFGDFGIARDLPQGTIVPIQFTPDKAGEFLFTCGMNMVRGKLIVR